MLFILYSNHTFYDVYIKSLKSFVSIYFYSQLKFYYFSQHLLFRYEFVSYLMSQTHKVHYEHIKTWVFKYFCDTYL